MNREMGRIVCECGHGITKHDYAMAEDADDRGFDDCLECACRHFRLKLKKTPISY